MIRTFVLVVLAVVGLVSCSPEHPEPVRNSAGVAVFADVPDPCELVSIPQIESAVGTRVQQGRSTGTGHGCTYLRPGGGDATPVARILVVTRDDSDQFTSDRALVDEQAHTETISVGEQGFQWNSGDIEGAEARNGTLRLRVLVSGGHPGSAAELLTAAASKAWAP